MKREFCVSAFVLYLESIKVKEVVGEDEDLYLE